MVMLGCSFCWEPLGNHWTKGKACVSLLTDYFQVGYGQGQRVLGPNACLWQALEQRAAPAWHKRLVTFSQATGEATWAHCSASDKAKSQ